MAVTCQGCKHARDRFAGPTCPAIIHGWVKTGFSLGCNLNTIANAILKSPTSRQESTPTPTPTKAGERQKDAKLGGKAVKIPNKTEAEYARIYLAGKHAVYEGHTFKMANGHKYTGDWAVYDDAGVLVEVHETKGGWAQFSEQRARLAFDQCRIEFSKVKFVWAKKHDKRGWIIK